MDWELFVERERFFRTKKGWAMSRQFFVNPQDDNGVTFHVGNQLADVIFHQVQSFDALPHILQKLYRAIIW